MVYDSDNFAVSTYPVARPVLYACVKSWMHRKIIRYVLALFGSKVIAAPLLGGFRAGTPGAPSLPGSTAVGITTRLG